MAKGKDPAVLWYWADWHGGTVTYTRHLKGCYMDLLYAQFTSGHLSLEEIKTVLGTDFASWGALAKKFIKDENGLYFNDKLDREVTKRKEFSAKQKLNGSKGGKPKHFAKSNPSLSPNDSLLENANENEIETEVINSIEKVKEYFDADYVLAETVIKENKFTPGQLERAQVEFWNDKQLDPETTIKPYSDVQRHFLRWCRKNVDRLKKGQNQFGQKPSKLEQNINAYDQLKKELE